MRTAYASRSRSARCHTLLDQPEGLRRSRSRAPCPPEAPAAALAGRAGVDFQGQGKFAPFRADFISGSHPSITPGPTRKFPRIRPLRRNLRIRLDSIHGPRRFAFVLLEPAAEKGAPGPDPVAIAACALLLEIAHADSTFTPEERERIARHAREGLGVAEGDVRKFSASPRRRERRASISTSSPVW